MICILCYPDFLPQLTRMNHIQHHTQTPGSGGQKDNGCFGNRDYWSAFAGFYKAVTRRHTTCFTRCLVYDASVADGVACRIEISPWIFVLAGFTALSIAIVTVSFQAIKAALQNPVKSLRSE
jgi:hypothetical protein